MALLTQFPLGVPASTDTHSHGDAGMGGGRGSATSSPVASYGWQGYSRQLANGPLVLQSVLALVLEAGAQTRARRDHTQAAFSPTSLLPSTDRVTRSAVARLSFSPTSPAEGKGGGEKEKK